MTRFNRPGAPDATVASPVPPMQRKPQRVSITMSWALHQRLLKRSDLEGRSLSSLAAHLLELACPEQLLSTPSQRAGKAAG